MTERYSGTDAAFKTVDLDETAIAEALTGLETIFESVNSAANGLKSATLSLSTADDANAMNLANLVGGDAGSVTERVSAVAKHFAWIQQQIGSYVKEITNLDERNATYFRGTSCT
ncbi:MAG: hypothetical protein Q3972_07150 [Corynebacterium sp.]|nr:hypothetical protein [Corynebacterium sp.]